MIGTEEAPFDVAVAEADVKDLAVGCHVGVVAVRLPHAAERKVGRNLGQVLASDQEANHGHDGDLEDWKEDMVMAGITYVPEGRQRL